MSKETEQLKEQIESSEKWMKEVRKMHDEGKYEMPFVAEYDLHMGQYHPQPLKQLFTEVLNNNGYIIPEHIETVFDELELKGAFNFRALEALDKLDKTFKISDLGTNTASFLIKELRATYTKGDE